jgi:hypothetical protein
LIAHAPEEHCELWVQALPIARFVGPHAEVGPQTEPPAVVAAQQPLTQSEFATHESAQRAPLPKSTQYPVPAR